MTDASSLITTEYAGNYVYENSVLQFFNHAEGYFDVTNTPPSGELEGAYVYQYKDHLGNVRLSYSDSNGDGVISPSSGGGQGEAEIREENNFYPFGLKHKGYNNAQTGKDHKYGFGNKEEQDELGLGWIDITARNYDPALGRWMNLDPLAELMRRHSPYNYAFDNPIRFIDPDGNFPTFGLGPTQYYNTSAPAGGNGAQQNSSGGWKATLNENGSTSYVAEKGASKESFGSQYSLTPDIVDKIFEMMGIQKVEGGKTEVSGEAVNNVTGSEVLKLDLNSPEGQSEQRRFDQFLFARDHSNTKGAWSFLSTDYYSNTTYKETISGNATINIDGTNVDVSYEIPLYRSATFDGSSTATRIANYPQTTKQNTGVLFKGNQENIYLQTFHPDTGRDSGQKLIIALDTKNTNKVFNRLQKNFPQYNYIRIPKTFKN